MSEERRTHTQVIEIPVTSRQQIFTIPLSGTIYMVRQYWLIPGNCWVFDLMTREGDKLASGIPLVTGEDLFRQIRYIINGVLLVVSDWTGPDTQPDEVPDFTHLGITGKVFYRPHA